MLDSIDFETRGVIREEGALSELMAALKATKQDLGWPKADAPGVLQKQINERRNALNSGRRAGTLSEDHAYSLNRTIALLSKQHEALLQDSVPDNNEVLKQLKKFFELQVKALKSQAEKTGNALSNVFENLIIRSSNTFPILPVTESQDRGCARTTERCERHTSAVSMEQLSMRR